MRGVLQKDILKRVPVVAAYYEGEFTFGLTGGSRWLTCFTRADKTPDSDKPF